MRIPQPKVAQPIHTMRAPTQPARAAGAGGSTGPQGTPGGTRKPGIAGRKTIFGQEVYLWILVVVEIALIGGFRKFFRRFHGG